MACNLLLLQPCATESFAFGANISEQIGKHLRVVYEERGIPIDFKTCILHVPTPRRKSKERLSLSSSSSSPSNQRQSPFQGFLEEVKHTAEELARSMERYTNWICYEVIAATDALLREAGFTDRGQWIAAHTAALQIAYAALVDVQRSWEHFVKDTLRSNLDSRPPPEGAWSGVASEEVFEDPEYLVFAKYHVRRSSSGHSYEGEMMAGKRNGHGVYHWPSKAHYEGQWANGLMHGSGKYFYPSGAIYIGR